VASRDEGEPAFSFCRRIYSATPENADRFATSPKPDPAASVFSNTQGAGENRRISDYPGPISAQARGRLEKSGLHQRRVVAISESTPPTKIKLINGENYEHTTTHSIHN
jgi:hypothetical protein